MEQGLFSHYVRELRYVRELGAEFARRFPKVAGRLGLSSHSCEEPHVERLLQGFALLSGRVHSALEADHAGFTQPLGALLSHSYLAPTPSMAVAQFVVDPRTGALSERYHVPRDTVLRARPAALDGTACVFRTAHPVELLPICVEGAEYTSVVHDIAKLRVPTREPIRALFRLRLRSLGQPFARLGLQTLPVFLRGGDETSARLYEQLVANAGGVLLRWGPRLQRTTALASDPRPTRPLGFAPEQHLLPRPGPAFEGHRLLEEYFAFPERFDFVELVGLAEAAARCKEDELELVVPLTRFEPALEGAIDASRIVLFATPAINLFPLDCGQQRLHQTDDALRIVADPARPRDFELHSLARVCAQPKNGDAPYDLVASHTLHVGLEHADRLRYVAERRISAVPPQRDRGHAYAGSELYLHVISQGGSRVTPGRLQQLSVQALCTNRDLPLSLFLRGGDRDFEVSSGVPAAGVRCVAGPSAPRPAPELGESTWRWLSHMTRNYLSLCRQTGGAEALREMLESYALRGDPRLRRQIDGVRDVHSEPSVGPLPIPGPRTFARGLTVSLECEEQAFAGVGALKLAGVLSVLFARHAATSSFTETVLRTGDREVYRWHARLGLRHVL